MATTARNRRSEGPELLEELKGMNSSELADLREAAGTDLFFHAKGILGYNQVTVETHASLCNFLTYDTSTRKLVLMPRGHIKSTLGTVARTNMKACRSVGTYRCLIANAVAGKAQAFLGEIKGHWESNELLRGLFPELVPVKFSGPRSDWSQESASLFGKGHFKESTWATTGTGSGATAFHFTHIVADDLIDERHKESPAEMQRAIRWNRSLPELLDDQGKDEICWIGTRKTMDDVYADVMRVFRRNIATYIREPIEDGRPIFPLKWSMEVFADIMENRPEEWAHDFMNNPTGKGGTDWGKAAQQDYRFSDDGAGVVFRDPTLGTIKSWRFRDLDIVITVDPNSGQALAPDQAAVVVHGCSPDREIFVLSSRSGRPSPDGLIDWAWDACIQWKPRCIGIEEAGQQNTIFYFEKRCIEKRQHFRVIPLKHNNRDKPRRIRTALDTPIKAQRIFTHPTQLVLRSQLQFFPQLATHNWDEIDALSYGPELYMEGMRAEDLERSREAQTKILVVRGVTGYGRSWKRSRSN